MPTNILFTFAKDGRRNAEKTCEVLMLRSLEYGFLKLRKSIGCNRFVFLISKHLNFYPAYDLVA
jgi:hypothetical protein